MSRSIEPLGLSATSELPSSASKSLNALDLHVANPTILECFHLAMEGENVPATVYPCQEHPGMNRRTVFGMKLSTGHVQKGNDPFNYEHKYPEDDPYKELADSSRFWKICVDEAAKIDAGKVADWTDALDVLLVFAGLFSAVVSTFVSQTFQTLQVDPNELIYVIVHELLDVQRAIDEHGPGSSKTVPRSDTSFHPSRTATWVNALWYVSLTLSLITALMAALTKQWIHHYMNYVQLGTPRARARVRHFRFIQLQEWHVPAIIGLLPVMMHVALGLFFAGLVIHLRAMSTPMSAAVGVLVGCASLVYTGTNLVPVLNPACPYKTPLSEYAYAALKRLGQFLPSAPLFSTSNFLVSSAFPSDISSQGGLTVGPLSLMAAEEQIVKGSLNLDSQVAVWMYTVSSNPSMQSVVLHTLSNLPPQSLLTVKDQLGSKALKAALTKALRSSELFTPDNQPAFERLLRSLLCLFPDTILTPTEIQPKYRSENSLSHLLDICNPQAAADCLRQEILRPTRRFSAVIWAEIVANAFNSGTDWLEVDRENSILWRTFVTWFVGYHGCSLCVEQGDSKRRLYSLIGGGGRRLTVIQNTDPRIVPPHEPMSLHMAAVDFMGPSLCEIILDMVYVASPTRFEEDVPSDIRLRLAVVQTDWVLKTSCSSEEGSDSTLTDLIRTICWSVGIDTCDTSLKHKGVRAATFRALSNIIRRTFETDILCLRDRQRILYPFFRCLASDKTLSEEYACWITDSLAAKITEAIFTGPIQLSEALPFIADALHAAVLSRCSKVLPKLCVQLCQCDWLKVMHPMLFGSSATPLNKRSFTILAAAFIEALHILKAGASPSLDGVLAYPREPSNLQIMCETLLISDVETQGKLWRLPPLIAATSSVWRPCLLGLSTFGVSACAQMTHEDLLTNPMHPHQDGRLLTYNHFDKVLTRFAAHVLTHMPECDCYTREVDKSSRWWPSRPHSP